MAYDKYGKDWEKTMQQYSKNFLIQMLKEVCIERDKAQGTWQILNQIKQGAE